MAFDLQKKGSTALGSKNAKPNTDDSTPREGKSELGGKTFAEGEQALTPPENVKAGKDSKSSGDAKGKPAYMTPMEDKRTLGEKFEDRTSLGGLMKTNAWTQRKWRELEAKLSHIGIEGMTVLYRAPFLKFLTKEFSTENLLAYEAIGRGMPQKEFYKQFLSPESKYEINVNRLSEIRSGAANGDYSAIVYKAIKPMLATNMTDSFSRMRFDDEFMCTIFQMTTGCTPPKHAFGNYE